MAQHDYVIDNQSSPSARADLNSLFQAIASQNSGATAPATTYANQIWYDTATDLLKMRNEANSGWITLGTVDQTNNVFNPNFLPATQAEAEAGTNNVKGMTALRSAQAIAALGGLAGVNIQAFTASGTYTPTSGYKYGIAFVTGGGGGSAGTGTTTYQRGGGGAGGTAIGVLNLTSLGAVSVTVGAGGTAGADTGASGTSGGAGGTSILSTLSGTGGSGSAAGTSYTGGLGGTPTGGIINISGATGGSGSGGAAVSGYGGGSFWGSGGSCRTTNSGPSNGISYGSGGGGGGGPSNPGATGAAGVVMIMEFK